MRERQNTVKKFKAIQDKVFYLVVFENNKRVLTYGASMLQCMDEMLIQSAKGRVCMIFPKESTPTNGNSRDIADYQNKQKEVA